MPGGLTLWEIKLNGPLNSRRQQTLHPAFRFIQRLDHGLIAQQVLVSELVFGACRR